MKKLLLIAAILAVGTATFAVTEGLSANSPGDTMYNSSFKSNNYTGNADGFGVIKDITTNDNAVHNDKAANILRDKGSGWEDTSASHIFLDVLEPIKIESEIDNLDIEAVVGDELEIDDIGFRIKGKGTARVEFIFSGSLFTGAPTGTSYATIRGYSGFHPTRTAGFGVATMQTSRSLNLSGVIRELEVDLHFDFRQSVSGYKFGTITAIASYE